MKKENLIKKSDRHNKYLIGRKCDLQNLVKKNSICSQAEKNLSKKIFIGLLPI